MRYSKLTIVAAVALAGTATLPAAAEATTPDDDSTELTEVELPDARILSLSPDGQLLAARTPAGGRATQLCVYELASEAVRSCGDLAAHEISMSDDSVAWSPDSTTLAFAEDAFRTLIDGDLWVLDATTGDLTNLTDDGFEGRLPLFGDADERPDQPVYVDIVPTWAPDGRSVAISRSPIVDGESGGTEIVSVDVATGGTESLTTVTTDVPGAVYVGMAWAPDGRRLYYSVAHPDRGNPQNGVWEYDRGTGESRQILASDEDKGPPTLIDVDATGTTGLVIYWQHYAAAFGTDDHYALLDLETGALSDVRPGAGSSPPAVTSAVTFSPDGTRLLFDVIDGGDGRYIVQPRPDGEPEEVAVGLDARPFMTKIGGGIFWANDGTVLIITGANSGSVLHLDPGDVPEITDQDDIAPGTEPPASVDVESFQPDTAVVLTGEATMRATASSQGVAVLELRPGAALVVIGEPVEAGGGLWVPVLERATGTIGYVEASLLEPADS